MVLFLVVIGTGANLARRTYVLWPAVRRRLQRKALKGIARIRKHTRPTTGVEFVASTVGTLAFFAGSLLFIADAMRFFLIIMWFGLAVMLATGAFESVRRGIELSRRTWARAVGKALIAGGVALSVVVANSMARHLAFSFAHEDPKFFTGFVNAISLLLTPLIYAWALALLVTVWAGAELILFFFYQTFIQATSMVGDVKSFLANPSSPVSRLKKAANAWLISGWPYVWRTASMLALGCVLIMEIDTVIRRPAPWEDHLARIAMVMLDFHEGHTCSSADKRMGASLEGNKMSLALPTKTSVVFTTTTCKP